MKLTRGLFTDCAEQDQPEGTYRFAKNIIDSNVLGSKENEDGFIDAGLQAPYTPIGIIPVGESFVVFSTNNTNNEIGLVSRNGTTLSYTSVYNNNALNFDTSHPIDGEYRVDVNNSRVVAWTDDKNVPRILNIDDLSGINDVEDLAMFQDILNPKINSSTINDGGGALKTSAIVVITKYQNADGSQTNWAVLDHVFYINDDSKSSAFNEDDGAVAGTISNKSITLSLGDCDTRYDTLVVGYIQSLGNIVKAYQAFKTTNASTVTITLTGSESTTDLSLDEVLTSTANYKTAKTITQLDGRLWLGNLTAEPLPDLQPTAINIQINYNVDLIDVISNTGNHKDNLPPALMPGEVYAFYLGVELNQGGWAYYHIPGRPALADGEVAASSFEGMNFFYFQVLDTSDKTGSGALTNLGYWENINERYPNDAAYNSGTRDLRNRAVVHHRMPTLDHLISTRYSGSSTVGITQLPRLSVTASNVIIPADVQTKIKRWKIFYAKKDITNSLVIGSDLLQCGIGPEGDTTTRWGTGGNWLVQAEPGGADTWKDFVTTATDTIRGHSLDLLTEGTAIAPTYARFNYLLTRSNLNPQYTGFRSAGGKLVVTGQNRGSNTGLVVDYTVPTQTTRSGVGFIKRLDNFRYLPPNALFNKFKTQYTEGVYVADINNPSSAFSALTFDTLRTNSGGRSPDDEPFLVGYEKTMYMQYFRLLSDVHTAFTQQDLVPLEGSATPSTTSLAAIGGNTFLCYMSYLAAGPNNGNPDENQTDPFEEGTRAWKAYIGYSTRNFNYRHQIAGDVSTYYHGKTDVRSLFTPYASAAATNHRALFKLDSGTNKIEYNSDYNFMNTLFNGVIWNTEIINQTSFPNTIIWTPVQNEESKEFSWRSFLSGDRYVIPKNKGEIINLQGLKNKDLLIHTRFALFKSRTDIRVTAEDENVFFKSTSIFDLPPEDLVPANGGYAGTQNRFACTLTKAGYAFVDDLQGKAFLYDGSLQEISSNGMRMFFRDFMKIGSTSNQDNPFTQNGYTIVFDERNNRLLVTKKFGSLSWTISYNSSNKTWISYHDYIPDYMFSTVDNVTYGIKDSKFYIQNIPTGTQKGRYYTSTIYSSYLDQVSNQETEQDKEYTEISWVTESYPNLYTTGQPDNNLNYTNTLTHLTIRTPDRCTGRMPLTLNNNFDLLYTANIRNLNRTWYFNDFRDIALQTGFTQGFYNNYTIDPLKLNTSMEWYDRRKFVDKYLICRYEYDNIVNNRVLFVEGDINYKYAQR